MPGQTADVVRRPVHKRSPELPDSSCSRHPALAGHREDQAVLETLRLGPAQALAAVDVNNLENIAVAISAHGVAPTTQLVIRAGDHEVIAETLPLPPLGATRDVTSPAVTYVLAHPLQGPTAAVVAYRHDTCLQTADENFTPWPLTTHEHRRHHSSDIPGFDRGLISSYILNQLVDLSVRHQSRTNRKPEMPVVPPLVLMLVGRALQGLSAGVVPLGISIAADSSGTKA
ncbi:MULTISPECIES: hypothetical protein [Streptomyces]|uniref:hypothetical protein n=1 Tax=Streptomyces TaxID=1883 RepID=UPI0036E790FE